MLSKSLEEFLQHLQYERNVSPHTLRNYASDLEQFREHLLKIEKRDDIPVEQVRRFEGDLMRFMENSHPGVLNAIREKKALGEEITKDMLQSLNDFKASWKESSSLVAPTTAAATPAKTPKADAEVVTAGA